MSKYISMYLYVFIIISLIIIIIKEYSSIDIIIRFVNV